MKGVAFLLCCIILFNVSCSDSNKETRERVVGYVGRADKNPFLAAERYLQSDDYEVTSTTGVLKFNEEESVVFSPASSIRSVGDVNRIIEWVENGGHFICFLERAEDVWDDVGESADHNPEIWSELVSDDSLEAVDLLSSYLDLYIEQLDNVEQRDEISDVIIANSAAVERGEEMPHSSVREIVLDYDQTLKVRMGGNHAIRSYDGIPLEGDWYEASENSQLYSRLYGYGRVTFISDGRILRNPYLKMEENAYLLDYLALGNGKVVFSLGKVRGFYSMLGEHAWMVLYGLLVLTVLWLWKNMPRFGPLLDVVDADSRSYRDQLAHTGQFYWKQKRDDALLDPLRDAVVRRLGGRYAVPGFEGDVVEELSKRTSLERGEIEEAMSSKEVRDSATLVRITKNLQKMLELL